MREYKPEIQNIGGLDEENEIFLCQKNNIKKRGSVNNEHAVV
jgi:hypothetical protein